MKVDIVNMKGEVISQEELPDIFNVPVKQHVLHDIVKMQLAAKRANSASVKGRSDVTGSQRKLYRQKGTGQARRGNIKSPLLRGGGVIFGPTKRNYDIRIPKKVRKSGLKMALSTKIAAGKFVLIKNFELEQISTANLFKILKTLEKLNTLVVIDRHNRNLELSSRNLPFVKVLSSEGLNVYDILKHDSLIMTHPVIKQLIERLN